MIVSRAIPFGFAAHAQHTLEEREPEKNIHSRLLRAFQVVLCLEKVRYLRDTQELSVLSMHEHLTSTTFHGSKNFGQSWIHFLALHNGFPLLFFPFSQTSTTIR